MPYDTLDSLAIREPLPIGKLGSVFWSKFFSSCRVTKDEGVEQSLSRPWTPHYSTPDNGQLAIEVRLPHPLRTQGFENVDIFVDKVMKIIKRDYTQDWNQQVDVYDLKIPKALIEQMEQLLLEWRGEGLMIHYCCFPGNEGDSLVIWAQFGGCSNLPTNPDETLRHIANKLSLV